MKGKFSIFKTNKFLEKCKKKKKYLKVEKKFNSCIYIS